MIYYMDHLYRVVSARFSHCEVAAFPFSYSINLSHSIQPTLKGREVKYHLLNDEV